MRLEAGPLQISAKYDDVKDLDRIVLTPLAPEHESAKRFLTFEKRQPRVGVHLGLRRDCGSTFAPVGAPQTVTGDQAHQVRVRRGDRNFPSPDVEKDNVNYLAGIREIGVRSEYTDGRDMPRLLIRSVEFEGPYYEAWPPASHRNIFVDFDRKNDTQAYARKIIPQFRDPRLPPARHRRGRIGPDGGVCEVASQRPQLPGGREGRAAGGA